jgi:hypothetical protein
MSILEIEAGQEIKHVVVEIVKKDATVNAKPEIGLFRGIRVRSEKVGDTVRDLLTLIMISDAGKKNEISGFSTCWYKILSIRLKYGTKKELIVFKTSEEDQKNAYDVLNGALATIRAEKKMLDNDPEIIDIDKYTDVPYDVLNRPGSATGYNRNVVTTPANTSTFDYEAKRKKDEAEKAAQEEKRYSPFLIKRQGDLPSLETLSSMKKNVLAIAAKKYKEPDLPEIEEKPLPKELEGKTVKQYDYNAYGYGD